MINIAIFASGNGTNAENLIKHFIGNDFIRVNLILSNKRDAFVLERAKKYKVAYVVLSKEEINREEKITCILKDYQIDFIVLAGFLLMVPGFLVKLYDHKIINIHPSLLPKFGGKGMYGRNVHIRVKETMEKETGITIHFLSEEYDQGNIIEQQRVSLSPKDTIDDIETKVHALEKKYYPQIVEKVIKTTFNLY